MKVLFIGGVLLSADALRTLIYSGVELVGVCTRCVSSGDSDKFDLSSLPELKDIPVHKTHNINSDESVAWINELKPDIIFCIGWSQLLGMKLLSIPHLGVVGFHPTALPLNRGRHPIIWALVLGLEETASTFFFLNEKADCGDIISQRKVSISPTDNATSLYKKITSVALVQLKDFLPTLGEGKSQRIPQSEAAGNCWRKRNEEDGRIDWRMGAKNIHNLVRGLAPPYPGAHFIRNNKKFVVWQAELCDLTSLKNVEPGKVLSVSSKQIIVQCGDDPIILNDVKPSPDLLVGEYL
jgi:methionyl-tRNA formyltransferase